MNINLNCLQLASAAISGIPVGMSYSCAETTYLVSNDSTPGKKMEITMEGVQVCRYLQIHFISAVQQVR